MSGCLACCGLYCGACGSLVAWEKSQGVASAQPIPLEPGETGCPGCDTPTMAECEFIVCAKAHETDCCAFCAEFPCQLIIDFNNSEAPHHHDVLENLRRARAIGKAAWLWNSRRFGAAPPAAAGSIGTRASAEFAARSGNPCIKNEALSSAGRLDDIDSGWYWGCQIAWTADHADEHDSRGSLG